jgi:hypothetical protein
MDGEYTSIGPATGRIVIVSDEACPGCGEDGTTPGRYPNRPKVCDEDGWWWRCYDPACWVGYYNPETGGTERKG